MPHRESNLDRRFRADRNPGSDPSVRACCSAHSALSPGIFHALGAIFFIGTNRDMMFSFHVFTKPLLVALLALVCLGCHQSVPAPEVQGDFPLRAFLNIRTLSGTYMRDSQSSDSRSRIWKMTGKH